MHKYMPFLKFKQNEIQAVFGLKADIHPFTLPLFDIPKDKKQVVEVDLISRVAKGLKQLDQHAKNIPKLKFFVDNYDLDDSVLVKGVPQYRYILSQFLNHNVVPVLAFDRVPEHNVAALEFCRDNIDRAGIRLQFEDFQSYALIKARLGKVLADLISVGVKTTYLIFDCRLVGDQNQARELKEAIEKFYAKCSVDFDLSYYVVTGSVIPANITLLMGTKSNRMVPRLEDEIWQDLVAKPNTNAIIYGDYGIVSPEFSELDMPVELMSKFSAPKVFYTIKGEFYAERGGQFAGHPRGHDQYFDIADNIVSKLYYRGEKYSDGDQYIFERSKLSPKLPAKGGAPATWLKATLSAHMTYVVRVR